MSSERTVALQFPRPDVAAICIDTPNRPANVLDNATLDQLEQAIEQLSGRDLKGVVLLSGKPKIFVAGADLKQIQATADFTESQIVEFCERGRSVMRQLIAFDFPSVCVIQGAAVGGGLELAMFCDYRIAIDTAATRLGLPEVTIGLIPSWSGTVHLPRLVGFKKAVQLITSGRLINAGEAAEIGLVDATLPSTKNDSQATRQQSGIDFLENVDRDDWLQRRKQRQLPIESIGQIDLIVAQAAKEVVANKDVFLYAPTIALEHLARTATLDAAESESSESLAMAQVYGSPANRGLLYHYFSVRHNRKHPGLVDTALKTEPVKKIGIVGAGLMGSSIASRCAKSGINVRLLDADPIAAASACERLNTGSDSPMVIAIDDYESFAGVDLIIESVVETLNVKTSVLQKIEAVAGAPKWLSTNTSAIEIGSIAASIKHPESFCGIHFCHPELMSLVEVVRGPDTSSQTVADAVAFVRQLGMMPIAINDCPGFVVNRLLAAMLNESLKIYSEGYPIPFIDAAMREFGFLGGPFQIIDIIGADTCMYAGRSMWENGLKCVSLSPILPRMVKKNLLGQKTRQGFYQYETAHGDGTFDVSIDEQLSGYRTVAADPSEMSLSADSIAIRILANVVNEASLILEEEIVADPRDIDLCIVHGLSFPTHHGGLLFWADQIGIDVIDDQLQEGASERIKTMRRDETTFLPLAVQ